MNYNIRQILDGFYSIKAYGLEERFTAILARDTEKLKRLEKEKDKRDAIQGRLAIALRYMPQLIVPLQINREKIQQLTADLDKNI